MAEGCTGRAESRSPLGIVAAIKSKDRRFLNNEVIATVDGQQIKFKGRTA